MSKQSIHGLRSVELENTIKNWNLPLFRARQIFSWIYKKKVEGFDEMSNLPAALRGRLKATFYFSDLKLIRHLESKDKTEKFLLGLKDKNLIEVVVIPAEKRVTACLSTQVGCKYKCRFCASGSLGFKRNLSTDEIIAELLCLMKHARSQKITHIVFMGIGEPFDNYDNLLKAIRIINDSRGLNIGARRITISTSGIIPGIKNLSREYLQVELSISLHAASDKKRSFIMPVNRKYPLEELLAACREYSQVTGRQITFEYVLIKNLNSSLQDARNLSKILKSVPLSKVNLIPSNRIRELGVEPPNKLEVLYFRDFLLKSKVNVTLRRLRGEDIEAACGQLRLRYEKE